MGTEYKTPTHGALLVAHDERAELWTSETTATSADTLPGRLLSATSALALACAGTPSGVAAGDTFRCQRPGYPDAGATLSYLSGSAYVGWDAPTSVQYVERVDWTSGKTADVDEGGSACVTGDDVIVLVTEDRSAAAQSIVKVRRRTSAGSWSSALSLVTDGDPTATDRMWPWVVAFDGRVRIYLWRMAREEGRSYLATWEADEDNDLTLAASWREVVWEGYSVDISSHPVTRTRVAFGGGQWIATYAQNGAIYQLASRDGLSWDAVGSVSDADLAVGANQALLFTGGAFVLAYGGDTGGGSGGDGDIRVRSVGSAYTPLSSASVVTVWTSTDLDAVRLSGTVDDSGVGWLLTGGTNLNDAMMWSTSDGGQTWRGDGSSNGDGRRWAHSNTLITADTTVDNAAPVWWRDRMIVIHRVSPDVAGMDDALIAVHMGGRTTWALPESVRGWRPIDRFSWPAAWWPGQALDSAWDTITGTVSRGPDTSLTGVAFLVDVAAASSFAVTPGTGDLRENGGRWVGRTTAGTVDHQLQATDATNAVRLRITQSSTGFSVYDDIAGGAALATVANTGILDIIAWVHESGEWLVLWGVWTDGVRTYTAIEGSGLTTALSATSTYATTVNASSTHRYYLLQARDWASSDQARSIGRGIVRDYDATTRLRGRPVGGRPVYIRDGLYVSAHGGPGLAGDTWTYTGDALYHVRQAEWTTGQNASPRTRWKSTTATTEAVAYKIGDDACDTLSPVWGLVYDGTAQRISIAWHSGSAWGSDTHIDLGLSREMSRTGSTLVPVATAQTGAFVQEDELVGGFAVDSGGHARRIVANTAGVLGSVTGITWKKCKITIELSGSESSGTDDWRILWPRIVYLMAPPSSAKGYRVRVGVSAGYGDLPESVHDGKILFGPAYYLGKPHGTDSTREYRTNRREAIGESGRRLYGLASPSVQAVTLTWQNSFDKAGQARGTRIGGPDYLRGWTGSGDPAYSRGEAESTLRALIDRWSQTGRAVAYVPMYERATAGVVLRAQRQSGVVVGTLDPVWVVEGSGGPQQEMVSDVLRLGQLRITEIP